jgi:UDP-N-acetylglucosamine--N-acetylmuramyl-(pentapeptide) pyrophosphoryl-undecaprenol N-acetylglucosamine transferase
MRVIISGGGTAGHVYPGLALAKALLRTEEDIDILYVGTEAGLEAGIVPQEGIPFSSIKSKGLPRKLSFKMISTASSVGKGFFDARRILAGFKPDVVVGMGAYVSLPIVGTAAIKKIPTVIHEQNAVPGMVNKMLAKVARAVATSFPGMEKEFSSAKSVVFIGNPVREEILRADHNLAEKNFKIDPDRKVILVFGGSRGAQKINEAMIEVYDRWRNNDRLQIVHATGKINFDHVSGAIGRISTPEDTIKYKVYPYIENMGEAYSVSDLLVCRSGATTIAEITALGIPAILIPYPHATDNHQEKNARKLEEFGAGNVILDKDVDGAALIEKINQVIGKDESLTSAKEAAKQLGRPEAADSLANLVINIAAGKSM